MLRDQWEVTLTRRPATHAGQPCVRSGPRTRTSSRACSRPPAQVADLEPTCRSAAGAGDAERPTPRRLGIAATASEQSIHFRKPLGTWLNERPEESAIYRRCSGACSRRNPDPVLVDGAGLSGAWLAVAAGGRHRAIPRRAHRPLWRLGGKTLAEHDRRRDPGLGGPRPWRSSHRRHASGCRRRRVRPPVRRKPSSACSPAASAPRNGEANGHVEDVSADRSGRATASRRRSGDEPRCSLIDGIEPLSSATIANDICICASTTTIRRLRRRGTRWSRPCSRPSYDWWATRGARYQREKDAQRPIGYSRLSDQHLPACEGSRRADDRHRDAADVLAQRPGLAGSVRGLAPDVGGLQARTQAAAGAGRFLHGRTVGRARRRRARCRHVGPPCRGARVPRRVARSRLRPTTARHAQC